MVSLSASATTPNREVCNECKGPSRKAIKHSETTLKTASFVCISCHSVFFCSKECQRKNWTSHKKVCAQMKADRLNQNNQSVKEAYDKYIAAIDDKQNTLDQLLVLRQHFINAVNAQRELNGQTAISSTVSIKKDTTEIEIVSADK